MTFCDFKPGDEVVCIVSGTWVWHVDFEKNIGPTRGEIDVIKSVSVQPHPYDDLDLVLVELERFPGDGFESRHFRKVQRRDLSAWLETATDFEEPTRAPVVEPA